MNGTVSTPGRVIVALFALSLLWVGLGAGAIGDAGAQATNGTNVTHHENPAEVSGTGDSSRVRDWLAGRLTDRLRESSVQLSQGQYEAADGVVGEEFEERLGQFVDVAGETDGGGGDGGGDEAEETAREFERTREEQRDLATTTREYRETYRAYQEARERGNRTEARRLARELDRLAAKIEGNGRNATQSLGRIGNRTGENVSDVRRRIIEVVENVSSQQQQVRQEAFVGTRIEVTTGSARASFTNPLPVRGQLTAENGTVVANRSIRIRVGGRIYRRQTSANGTFRVTYRPVLVPAGSVSLPVRYVPDSTAPYLGTATNASVTISQVTPEIETRIQPDTARFGDDVIVWTSLTVDGRPVPDAPVTASIGEQWRERSQTDGSGFTRTDRRIPGTVPPGTVPVEAAVPLEGRAIAPVRASTTLSVQETPTAMSINATARDGRVVVTGRLTVTPGSAGPAGVPAQPVTVRVGETVRTARTGEDGRYRTALAESSLSAREISVVAQFDDAGTNFEAARASTRLSLGPAESGDGSAGLTEAVVGAAVLALAVGVAWWWRRRGVAERAEPDESIPDAPTDAPEPDRELPLSEARAALGDGETERAVVSAYVTVRGRFSEPFEVDDTATPREFRQACEDRIGPDASAALLTLTEDCERTLFAPTTDAGAGRRAVEAAATLLDTNDRTSQAADD